MATTIDSLTIEISASAASAVRNIDALASALTRLRGAVGGGIPGVKRLATDLRSLSSALRGIRVNVRAVNSLAKLGSALSHLSGVSISPALGTSLYRIAMSIKAIPNSAIRKMRRLASAMSKLSSVGSSRVRLSVQTSGTKKATREVGLLGKLWTSLKRIAFYRVIRAAIKAVTETIQEGAQNAYKWSDMFESHADGVKTIAEAYDSLSSASYKMGNQLGAAWASLIRAIEPILLRIIDLITRAANAITQFFALLGGKTTYLKAIDYSKKWGETTESGAKAAKEWKNQLMGFDEINRLEEPSSGGSGGGSSVPDIGSMFEEVAIENNLDGIEKRIGSKINEIFETIYKTLDSFDFKEIGVKISERINNALEQIDFAKISGTIVKGFTSIIDLAIGALYGLDWKLIGKSIGDFFRGAFDEASKWIAEQDWQGIGKTIWEKLKSAIEGIDFASLAGSFFHLLGVALASAVELIAGFVSGIWEDINNYFTGYLTNDDGTKKTGEEWVKGVLNGIWDAIKDVGTWIYDNVFTPLLDGFKEAFGIHSPSTVMEEQGGYIGEGILNGILGKFEDIKNWIKTNITDPFINGVEELFGIKGSSSSETKSIGQELIQGLWDGIDQKWKSLKKWWQGLSLGEFKLKMPHMSWTTTEATGWVAKVLSALGLPSSVPKLSVDWYAKGGVINGAQLIGAGENGAEAIVPLERNTQWISRVAAEMNRQSRNYNDGDGEMIVAALYDVANMIVREMQNDKTGGGSFSRLAKEVTRWQNNAARANGF